MYWTSDVNGSAYGEYVMSTLFNENINSLVYFTIGTGVGAGAIIDGTSLVASVIPRWVTSGETPSRRLDFPGICPFHGDCLEA